MFCLYRTIRQQIQEEQNTGQSSLKQEQNEEIIKLVQVLNQQFETEENTKRSCLSL